MSSDVVANALYAWYQEPERGAEPWTKLCLKVDSPAPQAVWGYFTCDLQHAEKLPAGCELHLICVGLGIDRTILPGVGSQWPHHEHFQVSPGQTGKHVVTYVLRMPVANGVWQRGVTMKFQIASSGRSLKIDRIDDAGAVVVRNGEWDVVDIGPVGPGGTVLLRDSPQYELGQDLRELTGAFLPHPLRDVPVCKEFLPLPQHPLLRCHQLPVTQGRWEEVMGHDLIGHLREVKARGLLGKAKAHLAPGKPMVYVSLEDAVRFCQTVTEQWRGRGWIPRSWCVRLPRRREWERARGATPPHEQLKKTAWMKENRLHDGPHDVGAPVWPGHAHGNEHGFSHLLGNVYERTLDSAIEDAALGGCWCSPMKEIMNGKPGDFEPETRSSRLGFRVMLAPVGNWHAPSL